MFISREQVSAMTGYDVTQTNLAQAQTMIEVFVGRTEADVSDAGDLQWLGRAVAFQAAYISKNPEIAFEQVAIKSSTNGEQSTTFDAENMSPFMSRWAVAACRKVSWMRSRSVHTGSWSSVPRRRNDWEYR